MPRIREDLLVSLSTAQFDAFELTPRICLINTQWSLSAVFFSCRLLTKSLGTNFLVKKCFLRLCSYIFKLEESFYEKVWVTLKFPDANLLVLPSRVYIDFLPLLQSSSVFTLKFPLFVIMVPRYGYSWYANFKWFLLETKIMYLSWELSFFCNHDFCFFIVDHEFPLLAVCL